MTEVIGIDHIYLTVRDLQTSEVFYDKILPVLGFKKAVAPIGGQPHIHYFCRYYGLSIRPAKENTPDHNSYAPGLHHFCFRVESNEDIDSIYNQFKDLKVEISKPRLYPEYAPDYYAVFFSDPDGIRLEITNYRLQRRRHVSQWESIL